MHVDTSLFAISRSDLCLADIEAHQRMSGPGREGPTHLASSRQFLVINQDDSPKAEDAADQSSSGGKANNGEPSKSGTSSFASRPIGHKRNFFLDARDVYSAYQPGSVIGMRKVPECSCSQGHRFFGNIFSTSLTFPGLFSLQGKIFSAPTYTRK
jgi:hypothetical protein